MKRIYSFTFCIFSFFTAVSQNTGIGTTTPVQTLDVNGAIKVGSSSNNQPGSIRYNSGTFEGGNGTSWSNLGVPSKAIILSQLADTASLKAAGFSVLRQMDNWDTNFVHVSTNYPGSWANGFPLSSTAVTPAIPASSECVMYNNNHFIYYGSDAYLYDYDIAAQKWIKLPNISPLGIRQGCGVTLLGNEVYITGGWRYIAGFVIYNSCAKYNLVTNNWTTIANIPVTNCYHPSVVIGTDIYILDGASTFTISNFDFAKKMYRYNTISNTWSGDLAVAATPDYLFTAQAVSWNNQIVYQAGNLQVYSYDPISHIITNLTPGPPPVNVDYAGALSLAGNKLYMLGQIADTTNISSVPNTYMNEFFEVDLTNGNRVQLNVCQLPATGVACYQYNPGTDRFYASSGNSYSSIFNRMGAEQCDVILRRKGYWYYMKRN